LAFATQDRLVRLWRIDADAGAKVVAACPTGDLVTALAWLADDTLAVGDRAGQVTCLAGAHLTPLPAP
jgi:hypothetical protein